MLRNNNENSHQGYMKYLEENRLIIKEQTKRRKYSCETTSNIMIGLEDK